MKFFKYSIYQIDFFGSQVSLLQKKQEKYHTFVGSMISLGIIIFVSISFIQMIIDLYEKKSPFVISKLEYTPNPEPYIITTDNFFIGASIGDKDGLPVINQLHKKYFLINSYFCRQEQLNSKLNHTCTYYNMTICQNVKIGEKYQKVIWRFSNLFQKQLNQKETQFLYCLNETELKQNPIILEGIPSSVNFSYFGLSIRICTDSPDCLDKFQIEEQIKQGYTVLEISDNLLNQQKQGDPYESIKKPIILKRNKFLQIQMRHSIMETIENFFYYYPTRYLHRSLQYEDRQESDIPDKDHLFQMILTLDEKQITYFRKYRNILNILGDTGGLFRALMLIFGLLIKPLTKLAQDVHLVSSVFAFESYQGASREKKTVHPLRSLNSTNQILKIRKQTWNKEWKNQGNNIQDTKQLKDFLDMKQKKLNFEGFEKLTVLCTGLKHQQIQYGLNKIEQKLNIAFIIRKLIEIDKLKTLLLTPQQAKLFDYIPKPTIPIKSQSIFESVESIYFNEEKTFEEKVNDALEAYKDSRDNKDELNCKLLQMMDNEIKIVFDQVLESESGLNNRSDLDVSKQQIIFDQSSQKQ